MLGVREIPGEAHNLRIQEYMGTVGITNQPDEIPWCSGFVNWDFQQCWIQGTGRPNARSWLRWGAKLAEPKVGCVVIFWRVSRDDWRGHVGIVLDFSPSELLVIGGNQGNRVSIRAYGYERVLGYRMPMEGRHAHQ